MALTEDFNLTHTLYVYQVTHLVFLGSHIQLLPFETGTIYFNILNVLIKNKSLLLNFLSEFYGKS